MRWLIQMKMLVNKVAMLKKFVQLMQDSETAIVNDVTTVLKLFPVKQPQKLSSCLRALPQNISAVTVSSLEEIRQALKEYLRFVVG